MFYYKKINESLYSFLIQNDYDMSSVLRFCKNTKIEGVLIVDRLLIKGYSVDRYITFDFKEGKPCSNTVIAHVIPNVIKESHYTFLKNNQEWIEKSHMSEIDKYILSENLKMRESFINA